MVIRLVFTNCTRKIEAIRLVRTIGKIDLKPAKELIETLEQPDRFGGAQTVINGDLLIRVDPAYALARLIPGYFMNPNLLKTIEPCGAGNPGIQMFAESTQVVDLSK